jgi:glutamine synthetase
MPARLPRNLDEAVTALEEDSVLCQAVGTEFCDEFIRLKRAEWDAFNLQVSDWELRRYADAF